LSAGFQTIMEVEQQSPIESAENEIVATEQLESTAESTEEPQTETPSTTTETQIYPGAELVAPNYDAAIPTVAEPEVNEDLVAPLYTAENEEIARPEVLVRQCEDTDLSGENFKKYMKALDHRALVDFFAKYLHKHDLPIDDILQKCQGKLPEDTTVIEKKKVYVKFLSKETTEEEFKIEFEKLGEVAEVSIPKTYGNKSKGFGFVTFATEELAKAAVAKGKLSFHDQECTIELAREKREFKRNRGSRGRRSGGRGRGQRYGRNKGYGNQHNRGYNQYNRGWGQGGWNQGGYNQGWNQGWNQNYNSGYNYGGNQGYSGNYNYQGAGNYNQQYGGNQATQGKQQTASSLASQYGNYSAGN